MGDRARDMTGVGSHQSAEEVVVLTFDNVHDARRSLRALHRLHDQGHIRLSAAAVVGRHPDGRAFAVEQRAEHPTGSDADSGADVAELLTGPFGVVLENAPDALVGSLVDVADHKKSERLLRGFSVAVSAGCVATIGLVTETTPRAIDTIAARLDGLLLRRWREDVEADIAGDQEPCVGAPRLSKLKALFGRRHRL